MKHVLFLSLAVNLILVVLIVLGGTFTGRIVQSSVLDPIYARDVSVFETWPLQSGDVVVVGDTLVAGGHWSEMFPDLPIKNRGIVGDSTAGILARLDQILVGPPSVVVLMAGTFDVIGHVPRRETAANMAQILARLRGDVPTTRVILTSVLPRKAEDIQSAQRLNRDYAALAEEYGVDFLDLTPDFATGAGILNPRYSNDGMHLNGAGYARWQNRLASLLHPEMAGAAGAAIDGARIGGAGVDRSAVDDSGVNGPGVNGSGMNSSGMNSSAVGGAGVDDAGIDGAAAPSPTGDGR